MNIDQIINDLTAAEAHASAMQKLFYNAKKKLGQLSGSAPSGVKKSALSKEQSAKIRANVRKSFLKKAI